MCEIEDLAADSAMAEVYLLRRGVGLLVFIHRWKKTHRGRPICVQYLRIS